MNQMDHFTRLQGRIAAARDLVRGRLAAGSREESIYKGTVILFSQLLHRPPFLFIGINPGAGYFNSTGNNYRENELNPDPGFEYVDAENDYDYTLARQTRDVFAQTRFKDCLSACVKTNLFYTCTSNARELYQFNDIVKEKHGVNYWELSAEWTREIIGIVKPTVIICEGKSVINRLASYYGMDVYWHNEIGSFQINGGSRVIGYKRRYSHILNRVSLINALNEDSLLS
jgi:hypothetical protein